MQNNEITWNFIAIIIWYFVKNLKIVLHNIWLWIQTTTEKLKIISIIFLTIENAGKFKKLENSTDGNYYFFQISTARNPSVKDSVFNYFSFSTVENSVVKN